MLKSKLRAQTLVTPDNSHTEQELDRLILFRPDGTVVDPDALSTESRAPTAITGTIYDAAGNLTSITQNGVTTVYTYDSAGNVLTENRAGHTATYTYDAAGNLIGATVV